jgi:hypothetical protein
VLNRAGITNQLTINNLSIKIMENKSKGRPKGSLNKASVTLKSRINLFIDRKWDDLEGEYNKLEAKDKLNFIRDLMPYVVPKLSATSAEVEITSKLESMTESQLNELIELVLNEQEDEQEPAD